MTAFEARMKGGRVVVEEASRFQELEQAGYGEAVGKRYVLKDYEALFLLYAEKLRLLDEAGAEVSFRALSEKAQRESSESWTRFMIYRDLRSRGYVVDVNDLRKSVKEITKMGKEAIIAVIERRGEVIYYKVSRAHFNRM